MLVGALLQWLGVPFVEGEIETTVKILFAVGGAVWAAWGRKRLGDVTTFGFRIKQSLPARVDPAYGGIDSENYIR